MRGLGNVSPFPDVRVSLSASLLWQGATFVFGRMVELAREITIVIVSQFGVEEMLRRPSNSYWFRLLAMFSVMIGNQAVLLLMWGSQGRDKGA
ncbi:hypothetical protein ACFLT8_05830 [Chloroflexota bacterium]